MDEHIALDCTNMITPCQVLTITMYSVCQSSGLAVHTLCISTYDTC